MIYLKNICLLFLIKMLVLLGRGRYTKKKIFSCKRILYKNFKKDSSFNFVQVGANDGKSFDFLYDFVISRNSSGIVIEPVKEYFEELVENYKNFPSIIKINQAVHPTEKSVLIYKLDSNIQEKYPDWAKGIASINENHHHKTGIDSNHIIAEDVQSDHLMNILRSNLQFTRSQFHYFQIDTEGFDYEVLKQLDINQYRPQIIKFEYFNLRTDEKIDSVNFLDERGYLTFADKGDMIAIDLNKIKLI